MMAPVAALAAAPTTASDAANDSAGRAPKYRTTERVLSRLLLRRNDCVCVTHRLGQECDFL
jgi:hypothetical protein